MTATCDMDVVHPSVAEVVQFQKLLPRPCDYRQELQRLRAQGLRAPLRSGSTVDEIVAWIILKDGQIMLQSAHLFH